MTQRAKDYAVITELARLLPAEQELARTFDPDRVIALAPAMDSAGSRECVAMARAGRPRADVVSVLAREADRHQEADRRRLDAYARASARYLKEFHGRGFGGLPLAEAHSRILDLAREFLPTRV